MDRRQFLRCAAGAFTVSSLATALTACKSGVGGGPNPEETGGGVFRFPQGLACGDPSPTSGVFWTRVIRGDGQQGDIPVVLELSRTPIPEGENSFRLAMTIPVVAKQENDYIIHHKVTGLEPDTIYYFRFVASGDWSHPVGRFRSLPSGEAEVSRTQFGVINGFDWNLGHWEGLVALQNNFRELFYVIQLGGAINEMIPVAGSNRLTEPVHEEMHLPDGTTVDGFGRAARTYADYRYLQQIYRTDSRLQKLLATFTLLPMFGDNDFSNDSWQAHETYSNANTEQRDRLLAALAAWMQYMPLDWGDVSYDPGNSDFSSIKLYRNFRFGNLLNLMLTEQRLQRTDHAIPEAVAHAPLNQPGSVGSRVLPVVAELGRYSTSAQKILGDGQMAWLKGQLAAPGVVWNMIAGESSMTRVPLNLAREPDFPPELKTEFLLTADSWGGYQVQQTELIDFVRQRNIGNVVSVAAGGLFTAAEIWSDYTQRSPVMVECTTAPVSGHTLTEQVSAQLSQQTDKRYDTLKDLISQSYLLDNKIRPESLGWLRYLNTGTRGCSIIYVLTNQLVIDFYKFAEMTGVQTPAQPVVARTRILVEAGSLNMTVAELG